MGMREFADHILAVARENQIEVTNLSLQKIMYFVIRNSTGVIDMEVQNEIYNEPFLVWRYGPVVESQYERFSMFGSDPIRGNFGRENNYNPLDELIIIFLKTDVFRMVNASHTHPFWREHEDRIEFGRSRVDYPLNEVIRNA